jgi:hypothetical protein
VPRCFRRLGSVAVLVCSGVLPGDRVQGQGGVAQPAAPLDWVAASWAWLERQVTPNLRLGDPDPNRRRLLISYELAPAQFPRRFHRSATYDNALAALAFLALGERDEAAFTLDALARLVRPDGSLWFSYNTANDWPSEDDHESAIVRAGAVAWVGYALTFFLTHTPACAGDRGCERERSFFLQTATRLATYLGSLAVNDSGDPRDGLLRMGSGLLTLAYRAGPGEVVELYRDEPARAVSTENNISAWFFLRELATLTRDAHWGEAAERIRRALLGRVWSDSLGQFNQGFGPPGDPDRSRALDCAAWGALFLLAAGDTARARSALTAVERHYATHEGAAVGYRPYAEQPVYGDSAVSAFFFHGEARKRWRDLPVVWSEGTLGVALAYLRAGEVQRARQVVAGLKALEASDGGLRCASEELQYQMTEVPCVAASAWLVLVTQALAANRVARQLWQ